MKPGQIITTRSINDWQIVFRYPLLEDALEMQNFINTISNEHTFITFQGEQVTLEEESEYIKENLKAMEENRGGIILAWHNTTLVGSLDIRDEQRSDRHVVSFGISVKKDYRGQGVGKALLEVSLDEIVQRLPHVRLVTLTVLAPNYQAINLYQKLGFKEYGQLPSGSLIGGKYLDRIYMYLEINEWKTAQEKKYE